MKITSALASKRIAWAAAAVTTGLMLFGGVDSVGAAVGIERNPLNIAKSYFVDPEGETIVTYRTTAAGELQAKAALEGLLQYGFSNVKLGNGGVIVIQYTDGPAANDMFLGGNLTPSRY